MTNAWIVGSIAAVVAGVVGFFVVARGSAFVAHALPQSAFTGAAAASLLGINAVFGMGAFALASACGIAWLGKRGRHDVVTALALVLLLGTGELFLSYKTEYAQAIYSLLFGEVLGVSTNEILPSAIVAAAAVLAVAVMYRRLMLTSVLPEIGEARGVRSYRMEMLFLVIVALATTAAVPVVGALLMFSLMVGPPAASRCFTDNPPAAIAVSVALALLTVWASLAIAYERNWPVGFLVGTIGAVWYVAGRAWAARRQSRSVRPGPVGPHVGSAPVPVAGS
ncbi:MAG TPA: metal ABC transporter permease [Acidimicrobiales bacterium]|nr:metal ABC transporter permease [Acidimicrobiales bacterium]